MTRNTTRLVIDTEKSELRLCYSDKRELRIPFTEGLSICSADQLDREYVAPLSPREIAELLQRRHWIEPLSTLDALKLAIHALNNTPSFDTGLGSGVRTMTSYKLLPVLEEAVREEEKKGK